MAAEVTGNAPEWARCECRGILQQREHVGDWLQHGTYAGDSRDCPSLRCWPAPDTENRWPARCC